MEFSFYTRIIEILAGRINQSRTISHLFGRHRKRPIFGNDHSLVLQMCCQIRRSKHLFIFACLSLLFDNNRQIVK